MCSIRNLKTVGALLIATACLFPNAAPGANLPNGGRTNAARVKSKTKTKNLPSRIQLTPRVIVQSAPTGKTARKPLPVTSAKRMATTQVTPTKLSKIKNAVPRRYIRPGYHLPK